MKRTHHQFLHEPKSSFSNQTQPRILFSKLQIFWTKVDTEERMKTWCAKQSIKKMTSIGGNKEIISLRFRLNDLQTLAEGNWKIRIHNGVVEFGIYKNTHTYAICVQYWQ